MTQDQLTLDQQIVEICQVIAFYAKRLTLMRGKRVATDEFSRGYLSADNANRGYQTVSPWYKILEILYAELEGLMPIADDEAASRILTSPEIKPLLQYLHQIRAAYEFDKEIDAAKSVLALDKAAQHLADTVEHQSYWTLTDPVIDALGTAKNIAVIGSGPLPLTALAIVEQTAANVTCFELDKTAFDLGNQIIDLNPQRKRITCVNELAKGGDSFAQFDAVISAVLLGVDLDTTNHIPKAETLNGFLKAISKGAPVILRDPYRLGALLYPTARLDTLTNLDTRRFDPDTAPGEPYRSSFLILRTKA